MRSPCMCTAVNIGKICVCLHIFSQTLKLPVLSCILHGLVGKKNGTTSGGWLTSRWRHLTTGTCYCGVRYAATTLSARESSLRHTCKGFLSLWRAWLVDVRAETSAMTQWELVIVNLYWMSYGLDVKQPQTDRSCSLTVCDHLWAGEIVRVCVCVSKNVHVWCFKKCFM